MLRIIVKTNQKKENITKSEGRYYVSVKAPAQDNKANLAIIKLFKKKLNLNVRIVKGLKTKEKVLKVIDCN